MAPSHFHTQFVRSEVARKEFSSISYYDHCTSTFDSFLWPVVWLTPIITKAQLKSVERPHYSITEHYRPVVKGYRQ